MNKKTAVDCWKRVGIMGDRSCPELVRHIHCRNCPVFENGARRFFEREPPDGYVEEWTALLAAEKKDDLRQPDAALVFRIRTEWLALPARVCVEVVSPRPVRRVPHRSSQVFLGLASVRGELHLCFSLADLLKIEALSATESPPPRKSTARMIVARKDRFTSMFPVDDVLGLHRFDGRNLLPAPATVARAAPEFTRGLLVAADRQVGLLKEDVLFRALEKELA